MVNVIASRVPTIAKIKVLTELESSHLACLGIESASLGNSN